MTQSARDLYCLPAVAAEDLATAGFGKLTARWTRGEGESPFTLRDCFDQSLQGSGRLLLESEETFELLTADGGSITQSARREGDFVADFADGPVKAALADLSELRCLLPVGNGQMRADRLTLLDDEGKTQARAQLRILTADEGGALLVTLQGLRGYDKALQLLRGRIEEAGGKPLAEADLYALLFPARAPYVAKPEIEIGFDEAAFDTATDIIAAYLPVARANEPGVLADLDSEFLHDYRIALRKIRSVLSLFKGIYEPDQTEELKARFSALMAPTGRLRDLDVYLLEKHVYYELLPESLQGGLDTLFANFAAEREAEQARLARHLRSKGYAKEIDKLTRLFAKRKKLRPGPMADRPAHDYACALIWKRYRKVCETAAGIGPETEDAEIHQLRIHCKKLRYLMEFFAPVFPAAEFKSLIKPLKRLQDNLGLFNDYAVQQHSLQALLGGLDGTPDAATLDLAQSVGALIAVLHGRQLEERAKVVESFARFDSPETQQTFRALFHEGKE
ncbi:CHAD domain-containing protein [Acidimangrovimonas pyrenivorans]|uniref:CHAD domain-containing protein n=1 Tax=Acidimangrovimonas pyrenivorans TaxID=2030798 RepID=A0ABV7AJC4_9RHOB